MSLTNCTECVNVSIEIRTGVWAEKIGWTITGMQPPCSMPFDTYKDGETYIHYVCLVPGKYTFEAQDSYGDGWQGGTFGVYLGSYPLIEHTEVSEEGSDHDFTVSVVVRCP